MMWELRNDGIGTFAMLVCTLPDEEAGMYFITDGSAKNWPDRPPVMPAPERRSKKGKPRADISHLWPGSIVLNQRAHDCLQDLLTPFGQLLELDCQGEIEYFYNVTKLQQCIDRARSTFDANGVLRNEIMLDLPAADNPCICKDSLTASSQIYLNQAARQQMEERVAREKLTGIKFSIPGSWPY